MVVVDGGVGVWQLAKSCADEGRHVSGLPHVLESIGQKSLYLHYDSYDLMVLVSSRSLPIVFPSPSNPVYARAVVADMLPFPHAGRCTCRICLSVCI